jgi:hypothetical protein
MYERVHTITLQCTAHTLTLHVCVYCSQQLNRLWKKTEQPPPKPPTVDEDGVEVEVDEGEVELVYPAYVHIENVIREPAVKYYGIPKLGAYLAVPVTYSTWLHPDGVSLATVETEPAADGDGASPICLYYTIVVLYTAAVVECVLRRSRALPVTMM